MNVIFLNVKHIYSHVRLEGNPTSTIMTVEVVFHSNSNVIPNMKSFTAEDCFQIGKISSEKYDYKTAVDWLTACEGKYDGITKYRISEIIILSSLFVGKSNIGVNKI